MSTSVIKSSIGVLLLALASTSALAGNNSGAAFSNWPGTGLTKCYDASAEILCPAPGEDFYGQDAQYDGPARSYTLLGGGTMVQDNVTGLIWEMKTSRNSVANYSDLHDADNTYTWCDTTESTNGGNEGACGTNNTEDFINRLNIAKFGGHTDWRLPTMKELHSLVDYKGSGPTIDPIFATTTQSNYYWSSTTYTAITGGVFAWQVYFLNGADTGGSKINSNFVRAVRGGQTPVPERFVDNGDNTVTDTVTCLQWQKATMDIDDNGEPDPYTWQQALATSESLILAGHSDWRLPDISELKPLVNFSRYEPAIAPVFVPTTQSDHYWSSTSYAGAPGNAWIYSYFAGLKSNKIKTDTGYVRAVRIGKCPEEFPWEMFIPAITNSKHNVVK